MFWDYYVVIFIVCGLDISHLWIKSCVSRVTSWKSSMLINTSKYSFWGNWEWTKDLDFWSHPFVELVDSFSLLGLRSRNPCVRQGILPPFFFNYYFNWHYPLLCPLYFPFSVLLIFFLTPPSLPIPRSNHLI